MATAGSSEGFSARNILCTLYKGFWALIAPVVILGGIYSGFFTPTEAAIVAIFYTLVIGFFVYRELDFKAGERSLETTTWLTGRVLQILFTATVFGRLLVENQIPAIIADAMLRTTDNIYFIWAMLIFFLLFVGMFMETLAHDLDPDAGAPTDLLQLGIDPVHFGVVMVCALGIGFQTPPLAKTSLSPRGFRHLHRGNIDQGVAVCRDQHRCDLHHRVLPLRSSCGCRGSSGTEPSIRRRGAYHATNIKSVLYSTDLSQNSLIAFGYAAHLAKLTGADIHLLHVLEPMSDDAMFKLADLSLGR